MSQIETLYSAKQVATALKISGGMLRRYAMAFETVTSQSIKQHARDGRQYSQEQLDILSRAKGYVSANAGMSVEMALRLAMGQSEEATVEPPAVATYPSAGIDPEAFAMALERTVVTPLLGELQALRASNERLNDELSAFRAEAAERAKERESHTLPVLEQTLDENSNDGALVRLAKRLERWLGKS